MYDIIPNSILSPLYQNTKFFIKNDCSVVNLISAFVIFNVSRALILLDCPIFAATDGLCSPMSCISFNCNCDKFKRRHILLRLEILYSLHSRDFFKTIITHLHRRTHALLTQYIHNPS